VLKNLHHNDIVQRELGRDPPQMLYVVLDEPESAIAALNRAEAVSKASFFCRRLGRNYTLLRIAPPPVYEFGKFKFGSPDAQLRLC
jgi:hypothetical protein